jgi:uncharacterized membrane protein
MIGLRFRSMSSRNVASLRPGNVEHKEPLSRLDRLAVWMTERVGTMGFCLLLLAWTVVWLGWNTLAPHELRFDPYPAFVLWLFLSNMIQICLMPLIMGAEPTRSPCGSSGAGGL